MDPDDLEIRVAAEQRAGRPRAALEELVRDGACGLRQKDEDYGLNDPEIPTREPQDRGNCSNIEDNPLHPTMPDELVKELYVVKAPGQVRGGVGPDAGSAGYDVRSSTRSRASSRTRPSIR